MEIIERLENEILDLKEKLRQKEKELLNVKETLQQVGSLIYFFFQQIKVEYFNEIV